VGYGITFLAGHRLRVEITSSSHPAGSATSTQARALSAPSRAEVAYQTIFHDASRASRITLTVVDE
jgi:predicted acyl esterase